MRLKMTLQSAIVAACKTGREPYVTLRPDWPGSIPGATDKMSLQIELL
jgi:hypothetical protein